MKNRTAIKSMTDEDVFSFKKYYTERAYISTIPIFVGLFFLLIGKTVGLIVGTIIIIAIFRHIWKTYRLYKLELSRKEKIVGSFNIVARKEGNRRHKTTIDVNVAGKSITINFPKFLENQNDYQIGDKVSCELTNVLHFPIKIGK
jgi:hypothetical protein